MEKPLEVTFPANYLDKEARRAEVVRHWALALVQEIDMLVLEEKERANEKNSEPLYLLSPYHKVVMPYA
jgi:hypothetical protein